MTRASQVRVLLVDDHAVVREGYRRLLEESGHITVVGEAATTRDAVSRFHELEPDVVVMDIALPDASGLEATRRILERASDARVLVFSMYEDVIYADRAMQAGALGYVTKANAPHVLIEAVEAVSLGGKYLSHDIAQKVALRNMGADDPTRDLTAREFEILRLLVKGKPLREIATILGLNPKTVANHQSLLRQKLGVDNAVQLARIGEELLGKTNRPPDPRRQRGR